MPTHVYHPLHSPPRWYDRLLVHPWDNIFAVLTTVLGLLMVAALARQGFVPSASIGKMPGGISLALALCCIVGGPLTLTGLHWTGDTVSRGWALERLGWLSVAGGLGGLSICIAYNYPSSVYTWLLPGAIAVGAVLRFVSLVLIERNTRRTLTVVRGQQEESE